MAFFVLPPEGFQHTLISLTLLQETDFDRLFAVAADPLIWEGHPNKERYKKEVFRDYFDSGIAGKSAFLVVDNATNKVIGTTRYYAFQPEISRIAIGYTFLARKYWGGAYNKAMKSILLHHAFGQVESVVFHIADINYRSQKAIEKIGAIKINSLEMAFNGGKRPYFEYEIKKEMFRPIL
jgi:hypothetical protein